MDATIEHRNNDCDAAMPSLLLTPPQSDKVPLSNHFSPEQSSQTHPALFEATVEDGSRSLSPPVEGGKRSPSEAAMKGCRRRLDRSTTPARFSLNGWERYHAAFAQLTGRSNARDRFDAALPVVPLTASQMQALVNPPAPEVQYLQRVDSHHKSEDLALVCEVMTMMRKGKGWPASQMRRDNGTDIWSDTPYDFNRRLTPPPTATSARNAAPRSHKRKASNDLDLNPGPSPKKRHTTPATPKLASVATHSRKRSSQSDTHLSKGDARPTRQPANKAPVSKDFKDWPDFSPNTSTLDNANAASIARFESLSTTKGKDNSEDKDASDMHKVELEAAKRANLDCGRYLFTKRAVFCGYLKHLLALHDKRKLTPDEAAKGLKSWNKTAAQNCSSIDVNKTSKLFDLFWSKLGWFQEEHFKEYIENADAVVFPEFDNEGRLARQGGFFLE